MASVMSAVIDWFRPAAWTLNRRSRGSGRLNVTFRCSFTCFSVSRVPVMIRGGWRPPGPWSSAAAHLGDRDRTGLPDLTEWCARWHPGTWCDVLDEGLDNAATMDGLGRPHGPAGQPGAPISLNSWRLLCRAPSTTPSKARPEEEGHARRATEFGGCVACPPRNSPSFC
jgi:hypothetical protein